jgi:hypothetical protein
MDHAAILFHKQRTSARLRFLRLAHGGVLAPACDTTEARVVTRPAQITALHDAAVCRAWQDRLALPAAQLRVEREFRCALQTQGALLPVYLVEVTTIDPPLAAARAIGATFIELTAARGLPQVELELLRRAYELVLGG